MWTPLPGKKGIGLQLKEPGHKNSYEVNIPKVLKLNVYWNYSWGPDVAPNQPEHVEFVPMVWGYYGKKGLQNKLESAIGPQLSSGQAKRLLTYNEPDSEKQSNVSIKDVVDTWPMFEDTNALLGSPATVHGNNEWMKTFMHKVEEKGMRLDFVAIHWYGPANVNKFINQITNIYKLYGSKYPILITEFAPADWNACTCSENCFEQNQVLKFMQGALPWLEKTDWIVGYAWFPFEIVEPVGTCSALFDDEGELTMIGKYYASVSTENPEGDVDVCTC